MVRARPRHVRAAMPTGAIAAAVTIAAAGAIAAAVDTIDEHEALHLTVQPLAGNGSLVQLPRGK